MLTLICLLLWWLFGEPAISLNPLDFGTAILVIAIVLDLAPANVVVNVKTNGKDSK